MVTDRQTDRHTHKPSTVTLTAHARRGLIIDRFVHFLKNVFTFIKIGAFERKLGTNKSNLCNHKREEKFEPRPSCIYGYNPGCHRAGTGLSINSSPLRVGVCSMTLVLWLLKYILNLQCTYVVPGVWSDKGREASNGRDNLQPPPQQDAV